VLERILFLFTYAKIEYVSVHPFRNRINTLRIIRIDGQLLWGYAIKFARWQQQLAVGHRTGRGLCACHLFTAGQEDGGCREDNGQRRPTHRQFATAQPRPCVPVDTRCPLYLEKTCPFHFRRMLPSTMAPWPGWTNRVDSWYSTAPQTITSEYCTLAFKWVDRQFEFEQNL